MKARVWLLLCALVALQGAVGQESSRTVRAVEVTASSTLEEAGHAGRYAPFKSFDGDPASCWVEGKSDNGIGQSVRLTLDREVSVDSIVLMPGLFLPEYYEANNRIKKVKVICSAAGGGPPLSEFTLPCQDVIKLQRFNLSKPIRFNTIELEIVEVYPGSRWTDTCLSEVDGIGVVLVKRPGTTTADVRGRLLPDTKSVSVRYTDFGGDGGSYDWVPKNREVYVVGRTLEKEQVGEWNTYWYLLEVPTDDEGSTGLRWMVGEFIRLKEAWVTVPPGFGTIATRVGEGFQIRDDGTLWRWGGEYETYEEHDRPDVPFTSDRDWALVAAGPSYSVALGRDGRLLGWGVIVPSMR